MQTALAHREPDRVPTGELFIDEPVASEILGREAWVGLGGSHRGKRANEMMIAGRMDEYYTRQAEDQVALVRKLDLDWLLTGPAPRFFGPIPEVLAENIWKFSDQESGEWTIWRYQPETDSYMDVDCSLLHEGMAGLKHRVERLERAAANTEAWDFAHLDWIMREIGHKVFIVGSLGLYLELHTSAAPIFLEAVAAHPDLIERYLDAQVARNLPYLDEQVKHGVHAVLEGQDLAHRSGPMMSPQHFRRLMLPRLQTLTQACHERGVHFIKHTDGNITSIAQELLLESGIDAYHPVDPSAGMDIGLVKRRYGDRMTLMGNVDCAHTLVEGTPEQVADETLRVIRMAAPGGGFVLTSSNTIHYGVRAENYMAMLETVHRYGTYPIV
jgi:uroporphyrinogen decarboxylase